jgi:NADH:ubiquinone oxidoreductase subunit 6 (subunit J)
MRFLKIASLLAFIVAVLLIGISVFYYFVVFLPKQEQRKAEAKKQPKQVVLTLSPTIVPTSTITPTSHQILTPSVAAATNSAQLSDCIAKVKQQYQVTPQVTEQAQRYQQMIDETRALVACKGQYGN